MDNGQWIVAVIARNEVRVTKQSHAKRTANLRLASPSSTSLRLLRYARNDELTTFD